MTNYGIANQAKTDEGELRFEVCPNWRDQEGCTCPEPKAHHELHFGPRPDKGRDDKPEDWDAWCAAEALRMAEGTDQLRPPAPEPEPVPVEPETSEEEPAE